MKAVTVFWIRVLFYLLILGALLWTGYRAGGDPCERCQIEWNGLHSCREFIDEGLVNTIQPTESRYSDLDTNFSEIFGPVPQTP